MPASHFHWTFTRGLANPTNRTQMQKTPRNGPSARSIRYVLALYGSEGRCHHAFLVAAPGSSAVFRLVGVCWTYQLRWSEIGEGWWRRCPKTAWIQVHDEASFYLPPSRCAISVVLWVFCSITSQKQRAAQKMDGEPENARFPLQKASGWFLPAFTGHSCTGGAAATPPRPYFPSGSLVLHATQPRTEGGRQKTRRGPVPGKPTAAHPLSKPRGKGLRSAGRVKKC